MKQPHFCTILNFLHFGGFWGLFECFFSGTLEWVQFRIFLIYPGCPGDPKVGPHTVCVSSWDIVGGIQALGGPQGPPQTGFGVAQDGPVAVLPALEGKFGWKMVKNLQVGFCRTGCPGDPKVGPHTDCVASRDTVGGIQALGRLQGLPQMGFGVAQDGPMAVLAVL